MNPSEWLNMPRVALVGSRKADAYGREVTTKLVSELARAGVVIVSGLAIGIDAIAHQTALDTGGITAAVLPTPLQQIYPSSHLSLAQKIIKQGGTLLSEYPKGTEVFRSNFIERNRIVSGLADILLITEAAVNSGSLHTARFALDQGKTVMVVPGNITSPGSEGCNNLIKSGALPVTQVSDILFELEINPKKVILRTFKGSEEEQAVLTLIQQGISEQEELVLTAKLDAAKISQILTMLEINGYIRPQGGGNWLAT